MEFALMRRIPFVTTPQAKGLVNATHPLNRGVFGFAGHMSATAALREESAELILAAGTTFGEWTTAAWSDVLLNRRLVHIDATEEHLSKSPIAHLHVRGQVATVFARLIEKCRESMHVPTAQPGQRPDVESKVTLTLADTGTGVAPAREPGPNYPLAEQQKCASDAIPIKPQRLMRELSCMFPPETTFLADPGNSMAWSTHYLHPRDRRSRVRRTAGGDRNRLAGRRVAGGGNVQTVMDFAPMGWAIGSAIGTALGRPGCPVVCLTGDGSVLMNGQELTVAVAEELPIVFVVLNDGALGMVKHGQRLTGVERIAYALPPVDFCALAKAMGAHAHAIRKIDDLLALDVSAMVRRRGPTLLDVQVDGEEVPPMGSRVKVLEAAK
jgi:acetolactate synthase-1/2/3 large subunit